jgi:hypothetical protein
MYMAADVTVPLTRRALVVAQVHATPVHDCAMAPMRGIWLFSYNGGHLERSVMTSK